MHVYPARNSSSQIPLIFFHSHTHFLRNYTILHKLNMPCPTSRSDFAPTILAQRYPNISRWAIEAFYEIKEHSTNVQFGLSPEARALLNICVLPMPGFDGSREELLDVDVDAWSLLETQENYDDNKRDVDLYRLSHDILKAWKDR
jgi:hypothetical protein